MRILIAEDEPALRQQLQTRLAGLRYDTRATADGREALYWGTEYPFDAAVLDPGLPGLGGLEVIRRLRAQDRSGLGRASRRPGHARGACHTSR